MTQQILDMLAQPVVPRERVFANQREIYDATLAASPYLDAGNFTRIHTSDLRRLFDLYDDRFFQGQCRRALDQRPLTFRLSSRMTQAGGKTERRELRHPSGQIVKTQYEIAISTTLLFQTFQSEQRPITVTGRLCRDRLEALQRVMEHEIVHLIEMLLWRDSSCSAERFQSIANRYFGHLEHTHRLITPRERAFTEYGVRRGDRVRFRIDGRHFVGIVNRITKRATVLVEDPSGTPYSDGKRYAKYYVPIGMLERAAGP